jgi:2-amino-4-hydroxy-6-hydroxymethyldihydropteridine diphosphokinase
MIKAHPHIDLLNCSSWYQTKPVGPPQPDYLNGCITIKTELSPEQLLKFLLDVEQKFGRERKEKWGPRTLDLDIIVYDNLMIDLPHLKIPHPLMRERAFVLTPLAEIAPSWLDPLTGLTIMELRHKLKNS